MDIRPEILLHPQIPIPLFGLNPRSLLGSAWWNKERQAAYTKNDFHCWACGVHKEEAKHMKRLEAHECYEFNYSAGTMTLVEIVALCHACHNFIHIGRLAILLEQGKVKPWKYISVLEHGNNILRKAGIVKGECNNPYVIDDKSYAPADQWRLIIDGTVYFPSN